MTDLISGMPPLLFSFLAGVILGGFYFYGLWWTIERLAAHDRPELFMLRSLILRLGVVLPCFYLVMNGDWRRLALCLAGFILPRFILIRRINRTLAAQKEFTNGNP